MKRVNPAIEDTFVSVDQVLREAFILDLLHGIGEGTHVSGVSRLPVKQAGLALTDCTKTAPENWTVSSMAGLTRCTNDHSYWSDFCSPA